MKIEEYNHDKIRENTMINFPEVELPIKGICNSVGYNDMTISYQALKMWREKPRKSTELPNKKTDYANDKHFDFVL